MATTRKKSKELLNQNVEVDGRSLSNNPTALEQIWGYDGLSKYGTLDVEEYTAKINDMLPVDLQNHAREVGLRPDVEVKVLKERLLREFQLHVASYKGAAKPVINSSAKSLPKDINRILREGA
jgi:hypothetical protein